MPLRVPFELCVRIVGRLYACAGGPASAVWIMRRFEHAVETAQDPRQSRPRDAVGAVRIGLVQVGLERATEKEYISRLSTAIAPAWNTSASAAHARTISRT